MKNCERFLFSLNGMACEILRMKLYNAHKWTFNPTSEASQPCFDFVVSHHVIGGKPSLLGKEHDAPMQSGPALKQILPESPDSDACMKVRTSEAVAQRPQRFLNLLVVDVADFLHPLEQAWMEVNFHNLPLKAFVCPEALALRTSA